MLIISLPRLNSRPLNPWFRQLILAFTCGIDNIMFQQFSKVGEACLD